MTTRFIQLKLGSEPKAAEFGVADTHARVLICRGCSEGVAVTIARILEQSNMLEQGYDYDLASPHYDP